MKTVRARRRSKPLLQLARNLRRVLVCGALLAVEIAAFELWRGPLPGRSAAYLLGVLATGAGLWGIWVGLRPGEPEAQDAPASFLGYDRYRFLWLGAGLAAAATGAYLFDVPPGGHSGGSWLGYTLGTVAFGTMLWLAWFGVRKRSYDSRGAPLRAWLSAHVYLGLALLVLMPLHSAFEFGWNIHTLAFALAVLAIATGIAAIGFFARVPTLMTRNRPGQKIEGLLEQIADLDARCRTAAAALPDLYAAAVEHSIQGTRIGGGFATQLAGGVSGATQESMERLRKADREAPLRGEAADRRQQVIEMLAVKQRLLQRIARDIRYKALLDVWLLLHVPIAFAAVAAVAAHVFIVFYYR